MWRLELYCKHCWIAAHSYWKLHSIFCPNTQWTTTGIDDGCDTLTLQLWKPNCSQLNEQWTYKIWIYIEIKTKRLKESEPYLITRPTSVAVSPFPFDFILNARAPSWPDADNPVMQHQNSGWSMSLLFICKHTHPSIHINWMNTQHTQHKISICCIKRFNNRLTDELKFQMFISSAASQIESERVHSFVFYNSQTD